MTTEEFEQKQAQMSDEELLKKCDMELTQLCRSGARTFTMSVPPKVTDTDMLFVELIRRYQNVIGKHIVTP